MDLHTSSYYRSTLEYFIQAPGLIRLTIPGLVGEAPSAAPASGALTSSAHIISDILMATAALAAEGADESSSSSSDSNSSAWSVLRDPPGSGSTVVGATLNFANSTVGAGAIGLGGAIAASGGLVSVFSIVAFGILTKLSLNLLIDLTVRTTGVTHGTYEDLGRLAFGGAGRLSVLVSKALYSFGCLVAYVVVVRDNFGEGMRHIIYRDGDGDGHGSGGHMPWQEQFLEREELLTVLLSVLVILPLCLLRDMASLSRLSALSILAMAAIVVIVIVLYVLNPEGEVRLEGGTVYENWVQVHPVNLLRSLGTFVFTYVSQHTAHLAFESMDGPVRTVKNWRRVSLYSITIAMSVSLSVGVFVYMTFWQKTQSDIFQIYPPDLVSIDVARLSLCITMLLTFPLPFFTCREMILLVINDCFGKDQQGTEEMRAALLSEEFGGDLEEETSFFDAAGVEGGYTAEVEGGEEEEERRNLHSTPKRLWLISGEERQLLLPYHVALTVLVWLAAVLLAIGAPNLGDVLNLVGCATGTVIAFILPSLFSFQLLGYTHLAAAILVIGGAVGAVGTYFSIANIL